MGGDGFDWLLLLQAYKLSLCFLPLLCSLFTKLKHSAEQLLAADLSYCWLYPSKQAVDCFMLFARLDHVLLTNLK